MLDESAVANLWGPRNRHKPEVNLIACVGRNGKIGLNSGLPWMKEKSPLLSYDLKKFQQLTIGGVVVVGRNTWPSVANLDGTCNRLFLIDGAETFIKGKEFEWDFDVPQLIAYNRWTECDYPNKVWIAGGAKTYSKWLPHVDHIYMTYCDYDGEADTFFPWEHVSHEQMKAIKVIADYRTFKVPT